MRVLMLAPRAPFPADHGAALRNLYLLRWLGERHEVTLACFGDPENQTTRETLLRHAKRLEIVPFPRRALPDRLRLLAGSIQPDLAFRLWSPAMIGRLKALLAEQSFDVVQIEGLELVALWEAARGTSPARVILDEHNAEYVLQASAYRASRASGDRAGAVYSWLQTGRLRRFERRAVRAASRVIAVSPEDAAALRAIAPDVSPRVIPNGVDTDYYRPLARATTAPTAIFIGKLDYRPNLDALDWLFGENLAADSRRCPAGSPARRRSRSHAQDCPRGRPPRHRRHRTGGRRARVVRPSRPPAGSDAHGRRGSPQSRAGDGDRHAGRFNHGRAGRRRRDRRGRGADRRFRGTFRGPGRSGIQQFRSCAPASRGPGGTWWSSALTGGLCCRIWTTYTLRLWQHRERPGNPTNRHHAAPHPRLAKADRPPRPDPDRRFAADPRGRRRAGDDSPRLGRIARRARQERPDLALLDRDGPFGRDRRPGAHKRGQPATVRRQHLPRPGGQRVRCRPESGSDQGRGLLRDQAGVGVGRGRAAGQRRIRRQRDFQQELLGQVRSNRPACQRARDSGDLPDRYDPDLGAARGRRLPRAARRPSGLRRLRRRGRPALQGQGPLLPDLERAEPGVRVGQPPGDAGRILQHAPGRLHPRESRGSRTS